MFLILKRKTIKMKNFPFLLLLIFPYILPAAQNQVIPGDFVVERPTLICAGFEWYIEGDDNHNARVSVHYREEGTFHWKEALPLLRLFREKTVYPAVGLDYTAPNMFAGSIFDFKAGNTYECRFGLSDPDGLQGDSLVTVKVTTRNVPEEFTGGRKLHVYPVDYDGPKQEPYFSDLLSAYYGPGQGYWGPARVKPGDIILVHSGLYKADYHHYSSNLNLDFYGTYVLAQNGTPERPIVIRAAGDGPVIFDGAGCSRLFDVTAADYNFFQGLDIINADVAIFAGLRHVNGCNGLVVRNCVLENVGVGIQAQFAGSKDFYIADNIIIGRDDRQRLQGWTGEWLKYGPAQQLNSFIGIDINGWGHTVCHNYIAYFHDGIDVTQQGPPLAGEKEVKPASIDFYNNDLFMMVDDFIEADCAVHNIRVFRNRCLNSAQAGISAQPVYGGPAYFLHNIVYNVPSGGVMKFNMRPSGVLVYNNTFCAEWSWPVPYSNVYVRNNLFLGSDSPGRPVLNAHTFTDYTSFDYNGYRINKNSKVQFIWQSPAAGLLQDYNLQDSPLDSFQNLEAFSRSTAQEKHAVLVDYDIFYQVEKTDPERPGKVYSLKSLDFRLKPESIGVDRGCILANINDDYLGQGPDLGALESGGIQPIYGPRDTVLVRRLNDLYRK
jgi:hypothetical protein